MKLSAPKKGTFWISLGLVALAVIGLIVPSVSVLHANALYLVLIGYVVLFLGNTLKGF